MQLPADFDAQHFWEGSAYAIEAYTEPWPSDELLRGVEARVGIPSDWGGDSRLPLGQLRLVMLDYRACGPDGEPAVAHIDQENDCRLTRLAPNFEVFARGLVPGPVFEE